MKLSKQKEKSWNHSGLIFFMTFVVFDRADEKFQVKKSLETSCPVSRRAQIT